MGTKEHEEIHDIVGGGSQCISLLFSPPSISPITNLHLFTFSLVLSDEPYNPI